MTPQPFERLPQLPPEIRYIACTHKTSNNCVHFNELQKDALTPCSNTPMYAPVRHTNFTIGVVLFAVDSPCDEFSMHGVVLAPGG